MKERIASSCVCCNSLNILKSPAILMPFLSDRIFDWKPVKISNDWDLKTIENGIAYCICNSLQCQNCGHLFLDIRFSDNELKKLYDNYRGHKYVQLREKYEPGYIKRNEILNTAVPYLKEIERFLLNYVTTPVSILDWGGDTGRNTPFQKCNNILHVYDISNKATIKGVEKVNIETTINTTYDLIVCSNVLEHVPYPSEVVLEIKNAMSKGTILYIEVPHEDIIRISGIKKDAYKVKRHWHEHVNFYTVESIKELVIGCGLEVVALQQIEDTAGGNSSHIFQLACKKI
jgi:hypothetical protein